MRYLTRFITIILTVVSVSFVLPVAEVCGQSPIEVAVDRREGDLILQVRDKPVEQLSAALESLGSEDHPRVEIVAGDGALVGDVVQTIDNGRLAGFADVSVRGIEQNLRLVSDFMSEFGESIDLPVCRSATYDKEGQGLLYVNVTRDSHYVLTRQRLSLNDLELQLKLRVDAPFRDGSMPRDASGFARRPLIVRADSKASFASVRDAINLCSKEGLEIREVWLATTIPGGGRFVIEPIVVSLSRGSATEQPMARIGTKRQIDCTLEELSQFFEWELQQKREQAASLEVAEAPRLVVSSGGALFEDLTTVLDMAQNLGMGLNDVNLLGLDQQVRLVKAEIGAAERVEIPLTKKGVDLDELGTRLRRHVDGVERDSFGWSNRPVLLEFDAATPYQTIRDVMALCSREGIRIREVWFANGAQ